MEGIQDILQGMLGEIVSKYSTQYKTCFEILQKLLTNIIEHPEEQKFKVFKKTNLIIKTKLLVIPEIIDVLNILGYEEDENTYFYDGHSLDSLKECITVIKGLLIEGKPNVSDGTGFKVMIYQYDLTGGMIRGMSQGFLGKQIDGVWHTGVCVYGKEYFYGGGICIGEPKKTPYGYPVKEIDFGETHKTQQEFENYLKEIDSKYNMQTYNVLNNNCNHFTDAALLYLVGKHLPDYILKQHEEILNTPMGQMFRPMLENMMRGNNAFLPNMFEGNNNNNNFNQ